MSLDAARRDIEAATANVGAFPAWAEAIFYEAGLRCARAIVGAAGYRISSERGHVTAIDAADTLTGGSHHPIFVRLHRMRRTRHEFLYETRPAPSRTDLDRAARATWSGSWMWPRAQWRGSPRRSCQIDFWVQCRRSLDQRRPGTRPREGPVLTRRTPPSLGGPAALGAVR